MLFLGREELICYAYVSYVIFNQTYSMTISTSSFAQNTYLSFSVKNSDNFYHNSR